MHGVQPSEYYEYDTDACGSSDYRNETGHNEFPYYPHIYDLQGPTTIHASTPDPELRKRGAHAKQNLRCIEQDRAVALEAERAEIVQLMWKLTGYVGYRTVGVQLASSYQLKAEEV